jgi:inosose dehydratase
VLAEVRDSGVDFWTAVAMGIFCPLGSGLLDAPGVIAALARAGYAAFAVIEQDRVPGSRAPLEDLAASLDVLARTATGRSPS